MPLDLEFEPVLSSLSLLLELELLSELLELEPEELLELLLSVPLLREACLFIAGEM